jgi:hypothetical protein
MIRQFENLTPVNGFDESNLIKGSVSPKASTASMESGKTAEQIPKEKVLG